MSSRSQHRAMVVCEHRLGSNAFAMMKALRRQPGWDVTDFCDKEYVPLRWRRCWLKLLGRLIRPFAAREFNDLILATARQQPPDLFLVFKGTYVFGATLRELQSMGAKTYCVYPDVSFRVHGPYIPEALPCYDWVFTTKPFGVRDMREHLGVTRSSVILHAADPDLHRPTPLSEAEQDTFACDASFIGTWSPKKALLLTRVAQALPDIRLRIWGSQWGRERANDVLRDAIVGRPAFGVDYAKALGASKINIAILSEARVGASSGDTTTSRTFHIPASGGFMLHERTDDLLEIFSEGTHMGCFDGAEELAEKIAYYLELEHEDERRRIAAAGQAETAGKHTWDQRIGEVLEKHAELTGQPRE